MTGPALRLARSILASRRGYWALVVSAISSLGNMSLSVAIARTSSIDEFGEFAIAFSLYVLTVGMARSAVVDPLLALQPDRAMFRSSLRRASLIGIVLGALVAGLGLMLGLPYVVVLGLSLHGCVAYEYSKVLNSSAFSPTQSMLQELSWFVLSFAGAALAVTGQVSAIVAFSIWAGGCAVIGYVTAIVLRLQCRPRWDTQLVSNRVSVAFGLDFVIGTGSAQLALNSVSVVSGLGVIGALRGAGTLLGPVTLVVSSARSLLIPFLARTIASKGMSPIPASIVTSGMMSVLTLPLLVLLWKIPDWLGELLLGANWAYASPVLPFLAVELFFIVITTVPFAGHRALHAARSTLVMRITMAIVRVGAIVIAAAQFGAIGAAVAMVGTSVLSAILWWSSYIWLLTSRRSAHE